MLFVVYLGFLFFGTQQKVSAQSCSGGYTCHYNCASRCKAGCTQIQCANLNANPGCREYYNCSTRSVGCGGYPDCNIIPEQGGCLYYSGNCYNTPPTCNCSAWSACSASCGGGIQTRTCNPSGCGSTSRTCNTQSCAGTVCIGADRQFVSTNWCGPVDTCNNCQRQSGYYRSISTGQFCDSVCVADNTCPSCVGACTPNCTSACGQADGCGGTCAATDTGIPTITGTTPANGGTVAVAANGTFTFSWTASSTADVYEVELYPVGGNCSFDVYGVAYCGGVNFTNSVTIYAGPYSDFYFSVRPVNITCGPPYEFGTAVTGTITATGAISGTVYLDNTGAAYQPTAGAVCVGPQGTPTQGGAGSFVGIIARDNNGYVATIGGDGTYSRQVHYWIPWAGWPAPNNYAGLNPGTGYTCTCPTAAGCGYAGLTSPQSGVNYFITNLVLNTTAWWQFRGGNAYTGATTGTSFYSNIPTDTCDTGVGCLPYLAARDLNDTAGTAGIAVSAGGEVDVDDTQGNQNTANINQDGTALIARGTATTRLRENYDYFYRLYSMGTSSPTVTNDDSVQGYGFVKPDPNNAATAPDNGRAYAYNGDVTITDAWTVDADEEIVVFINGDLTITNGAGVDHLIQVAPGGFLAFIVSGDIIVNATVGNPVANNSPVLDGVYIANGTINIQASGTGGDRQFVGAGNFIGWSGVTLSRDLRTGGTGSQNATNPSEVFVFRPDFIENIPTRMTRAYSLWQETN